MSMQEYVTIIDKSKNKDTLSAEKESFIKNDFFFTYSFLLELNLSYNNLTYLPLSISQCFLLERVNISHNPMSMPPLVLFSLPKIRKYPENLIFGDDQVCTHKIVKNMLSSCSSYPQILLKFEDPDKRIRIVSVAPDTTFRELLVLIHPEFAQFYHYIYLMRTFDKYQLLLQPDSMPIAPYHYPDAIWSIELQYVPPQITKSMIPLIRHLVIQQMVIHKDPILTECHNLLQDIDSISDDQLYRISQKCQNCVYLSSRHFIAKLEEGGELDIGSTTDCVAIRNVTAKSYYVFKPNSISFDCINNIFILVCGNNAVKLKKQTAFELLPLFALAADKHADDPPSDDLLIADAVAEAEDELKKITTNLDEKHKSDDALKKLRAFQGRNINFVPK